MKKSAKAVAQMLERHPNLTHSVDMKVRSHVQREEDDWLVNTLMLEGLDVPFKFRRKKRYRSLQGALINITYYPDTELVAGMEFEYMKIVRIRQS
ncbi:hypothetical protein KJY73_01480 [Bowmanella sp. Y26]|uniref:Uncharacterized protein n=1 Tax=Bowmanella yangjiangensis TaxID=2811230 RepID=A0ABS3CRT0_9ALTE|nr:hypothetical protein [Bowmanella yangjiangensis]MBN7818364.1 hypothetical protein [Bowmanella yangjiangensis]MBT1062218.1 hypothetical protein [Bowmanella yangjiangensis]